MKQTFRRTSVPSCSPSFSSPRPLISFPATLEKPYYVTPPVLHAPALRCNRCSTFEKCSVLCFALERFAGKPDWRAVEKERIHSVPLIVRGGRYLFFSFSTNFFSSFKHPSSSRLYNSRISADAISRREHIENALSRK